MSPAFEHAELAISARPNAVSRASEHAESALSTPPDAVSPVVGHAEFADSTRGIDPGGALTGPAGPAALAGRQRALVSALVAGAPDPAGFDPARLAATRRALMRKRAGAAARAWPVLAASFGDRWASTFATHHAGHEPCGALRDGWDLARARRAELSADAIAELAEREALLRYDGSSAPRQRRFGRARLALVRRTH